MNCQIRVGLMTGDWNKDRSTADFKNCLISDIVIRYSERRAGWQKRGSEMYSNYPQYFDNHCGLPSDPSDRVFLTASCAEPISLSCQRSEFRTLFLVDVVLLEVRNGGCMHAYHACLRLLGASPSGQCMFLVSHFIFLFHPLLRLSHCMTTARKRDSVYIWYDLILSNIHARLVLTFVASNRR